MVTRTRNLYVAKQFSDRSIRPVGRLSMSDGPLGVRYRFVYLAGARDNEEFSPFLSFPDFEIEYTSDELFPFFQNRVMGRHRPDFPELVASLNLDTEAEPFEILERSGGHRETDKIEVFPEPELDPATHLARCRFFVRGIGHVDGAFEAAASLSSGDLLWLRPDPENPADSNAIAIDNLVGIPLGWVPRYLTRYVHQALDMCDPDSIRLAVEKVGDVEYGTHTRLMVQLSCCWSDQTWPFSDPSFSPIVEVAAV